MKILLIGSGGREHAIAWKLSKSKKVSKIYVAPGNGGTAILDKCENINITDLNELAQFAKNNEIYMTVVGPEEPLTKGIVDIFKDNGLKIFGPDKNGATLEGSKAYSKDFMKKYGVKTAEYEIFEDVNLAKAYLDCCKYPIVIKADGLAAGKGVLICESKQQAKEGLDTLMITDVFKGAGKKVVIEEFLDGIEASILSITDGKTILPFISAKDHKQIYDGDKGPNTGGMGVIAPNPYVTEDILNDFNDNIMNKTLVGIKNEGFDFKGIIFFGIMITKKGTYLLEYNVRMGDPETQSVLSLMESDLFELIDEALNENLENYDLKWLNKVAVNVVLASKGYPAEFNKGYEITLQKEALDKVFFAGSILSKGKLLTAGGRVLSVVGVGDTLEEARQEAYNLTEKVDFKDKYFRKDI